MPEITPNIGLKKPLGTENVNRNSFNENWDIIDQKVETIEGSNAKVEGVFKRKLLSEGTDILNINPGFYYGLNLVLPNPPIANDTSWYTIDITKTDNDLKQFILRRNFDNKVWIGSVHNTDGTFRGWNQIATNRAAEWINMTLLNGWVNYASTEVNAGYWKDETGMVRLKGTIKLGNTGAIITVLPVGFRPKEKLVFPTFCSNGTTLVNTRIFIQPNGDVYVSNEGGNTFLYLTGISFKSEQ